VEAVCKAGEVHRSKLMNHIELKLQDAGEKREARLSNLQDRIRERIRKHVRHSHVMQPIALCLAS